MYTREQKIQALREIRKAKLYVTCGIDENGDLIGLFESGAAGVVPDSVIEEYLEKGIKNDIKNKYKLSYTELKELRKIVKSETKYEDTIELIHKWDYTKEQILEDIYNRIDKCSNDVKKYRKILKKEDLSDDDRKSLEKLIIDLRYMEFKYQEMVEHVYEYHLKLFKEKINKQIEHETNLIEDRRNKIKNENLNQGLFKNNKK